MKRRLSATLLCLVVVAATPFFAAAEGFNPKHGYVPDEKTTIRVAEAVLIPIYGEERVVAQRPFTAKLKKEVWIVTGHLPEGFLGGVAEVKISKKTGEILSVTHGK